MLKCCVVCVFSGFEVGVFFLCIVLCVCVCVWDSEHNGWCRASDASHLLFETGLLIGLELHHIGSAPARLPASASV